MIHCILLPQSAAAQLHACPAQRRRGDAQIPVRLSADPGAPFRKGKEGKIVHRARIPALRRDHLAQLLQRGSRIDGFLCAARGLFRGDAEHRLQEECAVREREFG